MRQTFVDQMAMYSAYHRDPRNRATHFLGVPMIAFALLVPMSLVPFFPVGGYSVSLATLFAGAVIAYWIVSHPPIGIATGVFFLPFIWLADWVAGQGPAVAWSVFGAAFVGGWIIQLVGHAFEGRKPALLDNLLQIFIAPVFLMAEACFALGLFRPLHAAVEARWRIYARDARQQPA
jgi:uncharacterized membrane protein YGL010W